MGTRHSRRRHCSRDRPPNAKLMPIRILDNQGRGNTFLLAYAIELAVTNGADVINLSLGADCGSRILREAVASAVSQGVVLVVAVGNEGSPARQCPASLPGVLAVAAVDENRQRAEWSNYGSGSAWLAPGVGITSTFPVGLGAEATARQAMRHGMGYVDVNAVCGRRGRVGPSRKQPSRPMRCARRMKRR